MDLTPKQQTVELIRQAERILLVTGREPSNDQLAAMVALSAVLSGQGKQVNAVVTDKLPKVASILDTSKIARNPDGVRDFVISLNMSDTIVDKLKYNVDGSRLDITITPSGGNFSAKDASFSYGAYQFDLVIALGVFNLSKMDRLHEQNPTIFDGLHLINIDFHRVNDGFGSVNLVDTNASSVCEILVSTIESIAQGVIDQKIATALLAGIMAATNRFTTPSTTPKAMTIAAQLMSIGAKQQEVVRALYGGDRESGAARRDQSNHSDSNLKKKIERPGQNKVKTSSQEKPAPSPNQAKALDHSKVESAPTKTESTIFPVNSPLDTTGTLAAVEV